MLPLRAIKNDDISSFMETQLAEIYGAVEVKESISCKSLEIKKRADLENAKKGGVVLKNKVNKNEMNKMVNSVLDYAFHGKLFFKIQIITKNKVRF